MWSLCSHFSVLTSAVKTGWWRRWPAQVCKFNFSFISTNCLLTCHSNMRLFLAVMLLLTSSSGENPAVQVTLSSKALQHGKAKSGDFPSTCRIGMTCDEARCALPARCVCGCRVDHREAGGHLSSRHQRWNVHLVWYLILHTDGVRAPNWPPTPTHQNRDLLTPAFLICSITIENVEIPEPSVEFYQESTGLKASASGLSVALTGGWMTKYGLMWGSQHLIHKKDKNFNLVFILVDNYLSKNNW